MICLEVQQTALQDFMIQGGDPTGTGRGGESIFGKTFEVSLRLDRADPPGRAFLKAREWPASPSRDCTISVLTFFVAW